MRIPETGTAVAQAQRAEAQGWDGITFTDSQNLVGDPFVAVGPGRRRPPPPCGSPPVSPTPTPATRPPWPRWPPPCRRPRAAASSSASAGRHRPVPPRPHTHAGGRLRPARRRRADLPRRRHRRLRRPPQPPAVARPGPAAQGPPRRRLLRAPRARLRRPAPPSGSRSAWAPTPSGWRGRSTSPARPPPTPAATRRRCRSGRYVNVGCHPDLDVARALIAGGVAAFAHFSSMPGSTGAGLADADRAVVAEVGRRYDSQPPPEQPRRPHRPAEPDFVDRFAVVGPPERCAERLGELAGLGIERFVLTGSSFGADRDRRPHRRHPDHHRAAARPAIRSTRMSEHDLVIRGGTVVDGTGGAARTADVAIRDGVVTEVGRSTAPPPAPSTPTACSSRPASSTSTPTTTARPRGTSA